MNCPRATVMLAAGLVSAWCRPAWCAAASLVPRLVVMRYRRAVEKLRILASACDLQRAWPGQEPPLLLAAYAFGEHRGHLYDASEADPGGAGDGPVPFRRAEA